MTEEGQVQELSRSIRGGRREIRAGDAPTGAFRLRTASRMFLVAWIFFGIVAALGLLLRMQFVFPLSGFAYGNFLHAHSHVAFLGWVCNAFFALAILFFVPHGKERFYWRLFLVTQIAVAGILISFPIQGYGWASTSFSTMHMVCAGIFIWTLLANNRAGKVARPWLWAAGIFMLASCLGPLALGPIIIGGMGDTALYELSIAYYLHFQYNGWFLFFLLAVLFQAMQDRGLTVSAVAASSAFKWLAAGCILSFSLSVFPVSAATWLFVVAAAGGAAQVIAVYYLVHSAWNGKDLFQARHGGIVRCLAACAAAFFLAKTALQALAAWPGLLDLATNHLTIVAFMHMVFLGVVTPMLLVWAIDLKWLRFGALAKPGLALIAAGVLGSQLALGYTPIAGALELPAWPRFVETQFVSALAVFFGVLFMTTGHLAAGIRIGTIRANASKNSPEPVKYTQ